MKKHDIIENITIDKVGYEGIGLAKFHDGKKLIIKGGALPGMLCDLKVVKNYKDYAQCHIVHIHSFPPDYELSNIKCPHYIYNQNAVAECKSGCGGCKWQIASYDQQLDLKHQIVVDSFRHYPHEIAVRPVLASPEIWGYRNKIEYSFGKFIKGRGEEKQILSDRSLGFHRQWMFGKIVDIDQCFLVDMKVNKVYNHIKDILKNSEIPVYDQMMHTGALRHLMVRQAKNTNQLMVILSVHSNCHNYDGRVGIMESFKTDGFLQEHVSTFILITNDGLADTVATRESTFEIIWGEGKINETLKIADYDLQFDISPLSFFQTNTKGAELLYTTAIKLSREALKNASPNTILDLYCGTGTIGLSFLKSGIGKELIGIEEIVSAITDAKKNAIANDIPSGTHFFAGKAEKILQIKKSEKNILSSEFVVQDALENFSGKISDLQLVIVDPPRSGLHEDVVNFLWELKNYNPSLKICYISCNPVTLARDMKLLDTSYQADYIQPVDMFPHTHHIENIVILH